MRFAACPLLLSAALLLGACTSSDAPQPSAAQGSQALLGAPDGVPVVAVNDELITEPLLEAFASARGLDLTNAEQRARAIESLVENVVLAQTALQGESGNDVQLQANLALARLTQLSARYLASLRDSVNVSEEQLRDYYQQEAERAGPVEYHISHILFADEAAAMAAAGRAAEPGADFDALMTEYQGAGALQARDLGWGNLAQMPEAFPEILKQLEDGQAAPVAVQSAYGWHVLRRIASRPFSPPAFEEVQDGARTLLVERAVGERVRALRGAARVQQATSPQ
jgi:parvulin-like peptidyl-prolyl isomerase